MPVSWRFIELMLVWFFGWGFLLLRFPVQCYRVLSLGKVPTVKQIRRATLVGYMAMFFGCLILLEIAVGLLYPSN